MLANQLRLLLTLCAFALYQLLRLHAARTELARAQMGTLRERLFKLAGVFQASRRRITLRLPQHAPFQRTWARIAYSLHANAPQLPQRGHAARRSAARSAHAAEPRHAADTPKRPPQPSITPEHPHPKNTPQHHPAPSTLNHPEPQTPYW